MKYIYFQWIRLLKNKIAAELRFLVIVTVFLVLRDIVPVLFQPMIIGERLVIVFPCLA